MSVHIEGCTFTDCAIELAKRKVCDICGYKSETAVSLYPDLVWRCIVCARKAAHGRHISMTEVMGTNDAQLEAYIAKQDAWFNRLKEGDNGNT